MGSIWIYAPLAAAILGFLVFLAGVTHLLRGRLGRGGIGLALGGIVTIAGLAVGLVGLNLQTYARLTFEAPVAEVSVKSLYPVEKTYSVTVKRLDGVKLTTSCIIQGDEWVLSGRVQKWRAWATLLGLNATYTVEQMTNMYFTAAAGNGKRITACDLRGPKPKVEQYLPGSLVAWLMDHTVAAERRFGSANFMPLADGAVYRVIITQSGFNAEPVNEQAKQANETRDDILKF
jgi:hypothetical protein